MNIELTDTARNKINNLLEASGLRYKSLNENKKIYIRMGTIEKSKNKFQYEFNFEFEPNEEDIIIENDGFNILVNKNDEKINNTTIDFKEGVKFSNFIFTTILDDHADAIAK